MDRRHAVAWHVTPYDHALACLLHEDRQPVGLERRLRLSVVEGEAALERPDGLLVAPQVLTEGAHVGLFPGQVLGLVDEARLAAEGRTLRVRRTGLGAVLGVPERPAAAQPAPAPGGRQQCLQLPDAGRRQIARARWP